MEGLIDTTGQIFISPLYEDISVMKNGILVRSNGKSGLLTSDGILLIPCLYDKIEFLSSTIVKANEVNGFVYINLETGRIIYNSNKNE